MMKWEIVSVVSLVVDNCIVNFSSHKRHKQAVVYHTSCDSLYTQYMKFDRTVRYWTVNQLQRLTLHLPWFTLFLPRFFLCVVWDGSIVREGLSGLPLSTVERLAKLFPTFSDCWEFMPIKTDWPLDGLIRKIPRKKNLKLRSLMFFQFSHWQLSPVTRIDSCHTTLATCMNRWSQGKVVMAEWVRDISGVLVTVTNVQLIKKEQRVRRSMHAIKKSFRCKRI